MRPGAGPFGSSSDWSPWGWGPWWLRGRFFQPGEVRLAILSLLSKEPKHGYELMKDMADRSGGTYKVSAGTIYPTLQQLEDEGLITSEQQDGKKVYRITEAGQKELEQESATVDEIWRRAERWQDSGKWMRPEATAIAGSLGALAKTAIRTVMSEHNAEKTEKVRDILDRARAELEKL